LENDLRQQLQVQRWHGPSTHHEKAGEASRWSAQRRRSCSFSCIAVLIEQEKNEQSASAVEMDVDLEQRIRTMFEDLNAEALRFQELYYSERRHIQHLDQQRCAGYASDIGSETAASVNG
jgi:competence CoiA-like predicted nuclease